MKKILVLLLTLVIISVPFYAFAQGINNTPVIILKCDDYKSNFEEVIDNYAKLYNILQEERVTAGFGIMGNSSSSARQEVFWANTQKYIDGGIEIWSHGWLHKKNEEKIAEFAGMLTYDEMKENFLKVLTLVKEKTGYEITCFGAPYNSSNEECAEMINKDFPQITSVFFCNESFNTNAIKLNNSFDFEKTKTADGFIEEYNEKAGNNFDYAVIQTHPGQYTDEQLFEYQKMVQFLKSKNSVFMTPTQYTNYVKKMAEYRKNHNDKIAVLCNNELVDFDALPFMENDRTFVPIRFISEKLGLDVSYDESTNTAIIQGDKTILLTVNSNIAKVDNKVVTLDVPVMEKEDRIFVPLRFISENMGYGVMWDNDNNMAIISSGYLADKTNPICYNDLQNEVVRINNTPIILLKCDDYISSDSGFKPLYDLLKKEGVVASFGAIGSRVDEKDSLYFENAKEFIDNGFEIWHHGWLHGKNAEGVSEFNGMFSYDELKEDFKKTLDLYKSKIGYTITSFGPPYNELNAEAIEMMTNEYPQIKAIYRVKVKAPSNAFQINNKISFETATGVPSFETFEQSFKDNTQKSYCYIQSHPAGYGEEKLNEFMKVVNFLAEKDTVFMTPTSFVNYVVDLKEYRKNDKNRIAILVNNKILASDIDPFIQNDILYIPLEDAVKELNGAITDNKITLNGKEIAIDESIIEKEGKLMMPLTTVEKLTGRKTTFDKTVNIGVIF